ncbi:hypothetical protein HYE66_09580, partial [Aggregatibacter actinomycetemcomitans]|nr:hypothetical protein [Aggregatibacter actinomycetemcomitans]
MPIRPNQDYWHKINELWEQQEQQAQNETVESQPTNRTEKNEKTPPKPTALSGWRYLYHHNQL